MVYFFTIPIFIVLSSIPLNRRGRDYIGFIFLFIYVALFCFQYKAGVDWFLYLNKYENHDDYNGINVEYGYGLLSQISNYLNIDFFIFYYGIKVFCAVKIFCFLRENSKHYLLIFLLFICLSTQLMIDNIRQQIALIFVLLAVTYLCSGNSIKALLSIILGAFFHVSILALLPVWFLFRHQKIKILLTVITVVTFFLSLAHVDFLTTLLILGKIIAPGSGAVNKLDIYLSLGGGSPITIKHVFRNILLPIIVYLYLRRHNNTSDMYNKKYQLLFDFSVSAFILQILYENLFYSSETLWGRLTLYFIIFMIMSVMFAAMTVKNKIIKMSFIIIIILYSVHTMIDALTTDLSEQNINHSENYLYYILKNNHLYDVKRNSEVQYFWETWKPAGADN